MILTRIDKFAYYPANSLKIDHIHESIDALRHPDPVNVLNRFWNYRTLLKYPRWITPSGSAEKTIYMAYAFKGPKYNFLSFVTTQEKYQVFVRHAKIPIYPYECTAYKCLIGDQYSMGPNKIGGISFNPDESQKTYVVCEFHQNPVTTGILKGVIAENFINNLLELPVSGDYQQMMDTLASHNLINPFYHTSVHIETLKSRTKTTWVPDIYPDTKAVAKIPVRCMDFNQQTTAIGIGLMLAMEFSNTYETTLEDIFKKSLEKNGTILLWYEHDHEGKPIEIPPEKIAQVLKWIEYVDLNFPPGRPIETPGED